MSFKSCNVSLFFDALPTPAQTESLRDFLRSTEVPLDPSYYHSQIAASTPILAQYDTEIERLKNTLQDLIKDRSILEDHVYGCQAALAPVRRLPPEILVEIFAPSSFSSSSPQKTKALDDLAKFDLLQLSQVCSYWHRLVMDTPSLWSHIAVNTHHGLENVGSYDLLGLLNTSLERGADYPLSVSMNCDSFGSWLRRPAIALLVQHAPRWRQLHLSINSSDFAELSKANGKLNSLQILYLRFGNIRSVDGTISIFKTAPKLTEVSINAAHPRCCPILPWNQLLSFNYNAHHVKDVGSLLALMCHPFHPEAAFVFRHLPAARHVLAHDLPPITSMISSLTIGIRPYDCSDIAAQVLGAIVGSLTLPHLRKLRFLSEERRSLSWPLDQFMELSFRSSFCDRLISLDIRHITITEAHLIHSLTSLTSLERLIISDQQRQPGAALHVLVTSSLLRRLTLTPNTPSCLVLHRLKYFACTSFFNFDAQVYFDFVTSRVVPGNAPFHNVLRHFRGVEYVFDPAVHQKLLALAATGIIRFQLEEEIKEE